MSREKRITYLATTMSVFITSGLLYGGLGSMIPDTQGIDVPGVLWALLGGYCFSSVFSGVFLSVNYFSKKSLRFKIVAALLWPITVACCMYASIFSYIPYQIYNIIKIIKDKPGAENDIPAMMNCEFEITDDKKLDE